MGKVIVMNWVTLDGVMQGPGRAEEDTRDGFTHGGWGVPYSDEAAVAKVGGRLTELTGGNFAWLFGRRSYEEMLSYWNSQGGPFKDPLNNTRKYVASSNPEAKLDWPNSTLLRGDVPAAVADLKQSSNAKPRDHGQRRADRRADGRRPDRRISPHDRPARTRHRPANVPRRRARTPPAHRKRHNQHRRGDRHIPTSPKLEVRDLKRTASSMSD